MASTRQALPPIMNHSNSGGTLPPLNGAPLLVQPKSSSSSSSNNSSASAADAQAESGAASPENQEAQMSPVAIEPAPSPSAASSPPAAAAASSSSSVAAPASAPVAEEHAAASAVPVAAAAPASGDSHAVAPSRDHPDHPDHPDHAHHHGSEKKHYAHQHHHNHRAHNRPHAYEAEGWHGEEKRLSHSYKGAPVAAGAEGGTRSRPHSASRSAKKKAAASEAAAAAPSEHKEGENGSSGGGSSSSATAPLLQGGSNGAVYTTSAIPVPAGAAVSSTAWVANAVDGNTSSYSRAELLTIAKRFQPLCWVHSSEHYLPCRFSWYLDHVHLQYDVEGVGEKDLTRYITIKTRPREEELNERALYGLLESYRAEHPEENRLEGITFDSMDRRRWHMRVIDSESEQGEKFEGMNQVPFYTRVRRYEDHWEILYITMWAYNGPFNLCGRLSHAHSADVEHVTIRTNRDATRLEWVYYGAHGSADGLWKRPQEIEVVKADMPWLTRPVIYASDHSHGMYPSTGTWWRICGFANDVVGEKAEDGHSLWDPQVDPELLWDPLDPRHATAVGQRLLEYPGTLGEDGVNPPQEQTWWGKENEWQNNCFRRCFWPCRYIEWEGDGDYCYHTCQSKVDFRKGNTEQYLSAPIQETM